MVFSSILFLLIFLPIFLVVYTLSPKSFKNWWILIASIAFYAWGAPTFVFVVLLSTIIDFYLVQTMHQAKEKRKKRLLLVLSICINLGLLAYFKYANFFIENVNAALEGVGFDAITWTKVVLPIGISFYTFQTLTYSIDVYRGVHLPLKRLHNYLLYIMSFPQMIAGPIVRFNSVADQITNRKESIDDKLFGFYRFCIGLAKKVFIANVLGALATDILKVPINELSTPNAWIGMLAYTFQIYFDFSGYSDMAIGLGKMIGFKFPENFDNPYNSRSITEFWRRWHITLGDWMKNYLYIPLGGNKVKSHYRLYLNLWLVFLLSGLWHGDSWNFILWGLFHGFFLILDRFFLGNVLKRIGKIPSTLITFFIVVIGWTLFAIEDIDHCFQYLGKMFSFESMNVREIKLEYQVTAIVALIVSFAGLSKIGLRIQNALYSETENIWLHLPRTIIAILVFVLACSSIAASDFNPFIYFRF
jgi:alginate O-acetyltransferase complex protein AlgI